MMLLKESSIEGTLHSMCVVFISTIWNNMWNINVPTD